MKRGPNYNMALIARATLIDGKGTGHGGGVIRGVLKAVAESADFTTGENARPSASTIAKAAGVSIRSVRTALRLLEDVYKVLVRTGGYKHPEFPHRGSPITVYRLDRDALAMWDPENVEPHAVAFRAACLSSLVRTDDSVRGPKGARDAPLSVHEMHYKGARRAHGPITTNPETNHGEASPRRGHRRSSPDSGESRTEGETFRSRRQGGAAKPTEPTNLMEFLDGEEAS